MKNIHVLRHPFASCALTQLRIDLTSSQAFCEHASILSVMLVVEACSDLALETYMIKTPLEETVGYRLAQEVGLVPIMRAGDGMLDGARKLLPGAPVWHLGIFRDENTLKPNEYVNKLPREIAVEVCLILDPMLATGGTGVHAVDQLKRRGGKRIRYICLIAAPEGIDALQRAHPDVAIYTAAVDVRLDENGYIRPGLGDAGDRLYNTLARAK